MIKGLSNLGAGALSQTEPHDEFLELCAVSTSGELTEEEQKGCRSILLFARPAGKPFGSTNRSSVMRFPRSQPAKSLRTHETTGHLVTGTGGKSFLRAPGPGGKATEPNEPSSRNDSSIFPIASPILQRVHLAAGLDALCRRNSAFPGPRLLRLSRRRPPRD